jgi:hypothetical protein
MHACGNQHTTFQNESNWPVKFGTVEQPIRLPSGFFPMMTLVGPCLTTRKIKTLFSIKNLRIFKYTFIAKDYEETLKYI